jgi:hypothetical protein
MDSFTPGPREWDKVHGLDKLGAHYEQVLEAVG